ncbi:LacI family DNA-binding transcriptional regulator [Anoxynatronum buryatiense]|uniref:Transcriptional regulator, LacI family n=1 Tax=Anoxynatronum buryatiense TaxID=489973 RepID=A0AA45WWW7_9CLOT|nr:LacI family DNA-binding transcriptional regulator [Anoxynatronum buryatiense]SMP61792.1 transcriptional regulator, LacI family [Anoxynatronum buryatiense]
MKVTIKDIAKRAGVSHPTVSRCLNNSPLVSEETRKRVRQIAAEMHYVPNQNARGLCSNRTDTIGVIVPFCQVSETSLFLDELLQQIRVMLGKNQMDCIVAYDGSRQEQENHALRLVRQGKVDGLLIASSTMSRETVTALEEEGVPSIFYHLVPAWAEEETSTLWVHHDNYRGGFLAGEYLASLGHRRLACVTVAHYAGEKEFTDRLAGFQAGLQIHGSSVAKSHVLTLKELTWEAGKQLAGKVAGLLKETSGVFFHADQAALGFIKGLQEQGLVIPRDYSVMGYDDIREGFMTSPELTTIHQPREAISTLAASMLMERLKGGKLQASQQTLNPTLVVRKSCCTHG